MKNRKFYLLLILLVMFVSGYILLRQPNPQKILKQELKKLYRIDIDNFKPSITYYNEQWNLNGDGERMIRFDFSSDMLEISKYFSKMKKLPVAELNMMFPANEYSSGYYIYNEYDDNSFDIVLLDTLKNEGVLLICFL